MSKRMDQLALKLATFVLRNRWVVMLLTLILVVTAASGIPHLEFANNYRAFFGEDNPELLAFDEFQATYTKNDNILFVVQPADRNVFQSRVTEAVEKMADSL